MSHLSVMAHFFYLLLYPYGYNFFEELHFSKWKCDIIENRYHTVDGFFQIERLCKITTLW